MEGDFVKKGIDYFCSLKPMEYGVSKNTQQRTSSAFQK
jgi:hypothetical protein